MSSRLFHDVAGLDWEDMLEVQRVSQDFLTRLAADAVTLRNLLDGITDQPELMEKCEHYDILEKLVLAEDPALGVRLRLHTFLPGYIDRPHNHRWTYSSLILSGSYLHQIYGQDEDLFEGVDVDKLKPLLVRRETAGSSYSLHHSMIHSLVAEPYTVTLVLRGPAVKNRFLVMDKSTKQSWWQYGAADERQMASEAPRPSIAEKSVMTRAAVEAAVSRLHESGIA